MKSTAFGNAWSVALVSSIVGGRVAILPDPTDLIALIMLLPAWRLWSRSLARGAEELDLRLAIPSVLLAAFASLATSSAKPVPGAMTLGAIGDRIYADNGTTPGIYESRDHGRTWKLFGGAFPPSNDPKMEAYRKQYDTAFPRDEIDSARALISRLHQDSFIVAIHPLDARIRYRAVRHRARIERSDDAGDTWRVDWEITPERLAFMARNEQYSGSRRGPWIRVEDLIVVPGGSGEVVAALGAGVAVRDVQGRWEQYGVGGIEARGPATLDPGELAGAFGREWALLLAGSLIAGIIITMTGWYSSLHKSLITPGGKRYSVMKTLWTGIILIGLAACAATGLKADIAKIIFAVGAILGPILMIVGLPLSWRGMRRAATGSAQARMVIGNARRGMLATFVLGALPFPLWGAGAITAYSSAVTAACVLFILAMVPSLVRVITPLNSPLSYRSSGRG
jgi:hypothetical protein